MMTQKSVTVRNMASITISRLPNGAVLITGRKMGGARANPKEKDGTIDGIPATAKMRLLERQHAMASKVFDKAAEERRKYTFDDFMENVPGAEASDRRFRAAFQALEVIEAKQKREWDAENARIGKAKGFRTGYGS